MDVISMAKGVITLLGFAEATLEFSPAAIDVVSAPNAVIPADVHHAKANRVAVWGSQLIGAE
jgi:hypothetical protein